MRILAIIFCLLGIAPPVQAAYVGNPVDTVGQGRWAAGFGMTFLQDRSLMPSGFTQSPLTSWAGLQEGTLEDAKQAEARFQYGLTENLELTLKLGFSGYTLRTGFQDTSRTDFEYGESPYLGLGGKLFTEFEEEGLVYGIDFQYLTHLQDVELDSVRQDGFAADTFSGGNAEIEEFQLMFIAGSKYMLEAGAYFLPYMGLGYNRYSFHAESIAYSPGGIPLSIGEIKLEEEDGLLVLVGCDVRYTESLSINLEARFAGEKAFSGGFIFRF